jgi:hypothetical protein
MSCAERIQTQLIWSANAADYAKQAIFFDGKSDGIAIFPVKSKLSSAIHYRSTPFKMNPSLTIEWE